MKIRILFIIGMIMTLILFMSSCSASEDVGSVIDEPKEEVETEQPVQLSKRFVDLEVKPLSSYGRAGEEFGFSTRLTSRGVETNFQVKLHHEIISKESGDPVIAKDETIGLEIIASKRSELLIPKGTEEGRYILETTATYDSGSADSSFEFDIEPAVEVKTAASGPVFVQSGSSSTPSSSSTSGSSTSASNPPSPDYTRHIAFVNVTGLGFVPSEIYIKKGSWVKWINVDTSSHTATGAGFNAVLRAGDDYIHQFNESRVYSYTDTYSGTNAGTIYVEK